MPEEKRTQNARELIEAQADEPNFPSRRPMRPAGPMRPGGSMTGPVSRPAGDFSPREMVLIKDYVLLELVRGQGNFYEKLVNTLVNGTELEPGQLQHFIDEAANIPGLTEQHQALVQKIQQVLERKQAQGPPA